MSDDLYNDALVALAREKAAAGRMETPDGTGTADNPLCGDRVTVDIALAGDRVEDLMQKTRGCILTQAAASMLAKHAAGVPLAEAEALRERVRAWLAGETIETGWDELDFFAPVRAVKSRHDCVLIAFDALIEAAKATKRA